MIERFVTVKTRTRNKDKLLVKLYKNNISVFDCVKKGDYLFLKVKYSDLKKLKERIITNKFRYVKDEGVYHLKNIITPLKVLIIVLFILLINIFSQVIVSVDVIHSNKEIRELIKSTLEDYGIKSLSIRKDFEELEKIKKEIVNTYKDKLEWLEIERKGMKYIVRIEERIINNLANESKYCHIIASKSGIISSIHSTKGEILVKNGQYVNEGERLISGEIMFNEEIKDNVCAKGNVLAEVWYNTTVHLPKKYQSAKRTNKMRFNMLLKTDKKKYKIFKSRLRKFETEEVKLFTIFNFTFYLLKEYEVNVAEKEYTLDTGLEKALELADQKMNIKLKNNEKINSRNVLKKSINDSTIDIELFYVVTEDITKYEEYEVILEEEGS